MGDRLQTNPDYAAALALPLAAGDGPHPAALYRALRRAIEEGRLEPGARLPPTREIARQSGFARSAAVAAYETLIADGFAEARVGAGTFVAAHVPLVGAPPPATEDPPLVAPRANLPGAIGRGWRDPRTLDTLRRLLTRHLARPTADLFHYADPRGSRVLREELAHYLATARGVRCTARNIVITAGTQHGLDLFIRAALEPGDRVWFEDPGYPTAREALGAAGMTVVPVPVDAQGLSVDAGADLAPQARAAYVTPSHQFPLGVAMTMPRRLALVDWAHRNDAFIVEDDYDSEFRYAGAPLTALQGIDDGGRVVYLGSFSKVLFPGLRVGYAVVPDRLLDAYVAARARADRFPPTLMEPALAAFLGEGHFAAHLRRSRRAAKAARDALVAALREIGLPARAPDQGLHLLVDLPSGRRDTDIAEDAIRRGLGARALSPLFAGEGGRDGFLLGFSGTPPETLAAATRQALTDLGG